MFFCLLECFCKEGLRSSHQTNVNADHRSHSLDTKTSECPPPVLMCVFSSLNTHLAFQVMHRAQSNSPRIAPKNYNSFTEKQDINFEELLKLPGYKPRPRPPSYPVHVSPTRHHIHTPRIRITCVPEPAYSEPVGSRRSPDRSPDRSADSRGRSPSRLVSRRRNRCFLILPSVQLPN